MGALIFSQFPMFLQQYQIRLSGHVEELEQQVKAMRHTAELSGKSLSEYIHKFLHSQDFDFVNQGLFMEGMLNRLRSLQNAFQTIQESSVVTKPIEFIVHFKQDIANSTLNTFVPGFSFSLEEFFYILLGIVAGVCVYRILRRTTLLSYSLLKLLITLFWGRVKSLST